MKKSINSDLYFGKLFLRVRPVVPNNKQQGGIFKASLGNSKAI